MNQNRPVNSIFRPDKIWTEEQKRRLSKVYELILSWPDTETETADRDEFGDQTQSAAETPARDEQGA